MYRLTAQSMIAMILAAVLCSTLLGANTVIGVVTAEGSFRLDNSAVNDHATLFDGNVLQTGATAPVVDLKTGGRIELGPNSTARFSGQRLVLEDGIGEVASSKGFEIEARTLRVKPVDAASVARVEVRGQRQVLVAAYHAPVRVFNKSGVVVAYIPAGTTLSFEPQAGGGTTVGGCLLTKDGKFIIVDPSTARVLAEVRGSDVTAARVGNLVTVTGTVIPGATSTIQGVQVIGETGLQQTTTTPTQACSDAARKAAADPVNVGSGAVTESAKGGVTKGRSSAPYIIGGVAVGGGVIGVIAATRGKKS